MGVHWSTALYKSERSHSSTSSETYTLCGSVALFAPCFFNYPRVSPYSLCCYSAGVQHNSNFHYLPTSAVLRSKKYKASTSCANNEKTKNTIDPTITKNISSSIQIQSRGKLKTVINFNCHPFCKLQFVHQHLRAAGMTRDN
jgi:hypothetical protein